MSKLSNAVLVTTAFGAACIAAAPLTVPAGKFLGGVASALFNSAGMPVEPSDAMNVGAGIAAIAPALPVEGLRRAASAVYALFQLSA